MHRVKKAPRRISPTSDSFRRDGVRREAVEILRLGIVIRIPGQNLPLAIDKYFFGLQVLRHFGLKNAIGPRFPNKVFQFDPAAEDGVFILIRLKNNRSLFGARILRGEDKGFRQIIGSFAQVNRAPLLA